MQNKKNWVRYFFAAIFLSLGYSLLFAAKLQVVEIRQKAGKTSLFFKTDIPVHHRIFTLTNPDRIVIDFEKTTLAFAISKFKLDNPLVKNIRTGHPNPQTLRLVLEVNSAVLPRPVLPSKSSKTNFIFALESATNPLTIVTKKVPANSSNAKALGTTTKLLPRKVIVVLDPGHGGKDPGARGPRKTLEKNVTLAIAQQLKLIIDKEPGMRAVLTRQGDYYVGLRERLTIARKYNADVFVSIHADAFIRQSSNGASIFALSQRGATSEAARWLAEKENYSELGGVNLKNLDDQSGLVRTVLIDLSQTATVGASLHMGEYVLKNLSRITRLHNVKVEQARFMVLKSPDIPSILIETGFISNPREEASLSNYKYQSRLARSIFSGLKRYFWEYPPHGTTIEAQANNRIHIVKAGDTYQKLASRYRVPVSVIARANHAHGTTILIGQHLIIPAVV